MARAAKRAIDVPGESERRAEATARKNRSAARLNSIAGQTFEQLTPPQRDLLLKALAIQAGLIEDSEDA